MSRTAKTRESSLRWFLAKPPSVTFSGLHLKRTPVVNGQARWFPTTPQPAIGTIASGSMKAGLSGPIPVRVDATAKAMLLSLIDDDAIDAGRTLARVCEVLELDRQRAWCWKHRQLVGALDGTSPTESSAACGTTSTNAEMTPLCGRLTRERRTPSPRLGSGPGVPVPIHRRSGPGPPRPRPCWSTASGPLAQETWRSGRVDPTTSPS